MAKGTVNKVILIGRLGKDPAVKYTPSGRAVANFSIATNEAWTKEGEKHEQTDWHNIVLWGKTAEIAGQYLVKGSRVFIDGKLRTRQYDKDGQTHYMTEVIGDRLEFLDSKPQGQDNVPNEQGSEDDMPF